MTPRQLADSIVVSGLLTLMLYLGLLLAGRW